MTKPTAKARRQEKALEEVAKRREPTAAEREVIAAAQALESARPARAEIKTTRKKKPGDDTLILSVGPPHNDVAGWHTHLRHTFGTSSHDFPTIAVRRMEPVLREVGTPYASDERINAALAVFGAIAPENELQALVAEQIVTTHELSMTMMGRARGADTLQKAEAFTNMATKLSRTMATHIEALAKLRHGGKQQVVVKHEYHVSGHAIVGDGTQAILQQGGGGAPGIAAQPHGAPDVGALGFAPGLPLRGEDALRYALPAGGYEGAHALPDARGQEPRSAAGSGERQLSARAADERNEGAAAPGGAADSICADRVGFGNSTRARARAERAGRGAS